MLKNSLFLSVMIIFPTIALASSDSETTRALIRQWHPELPVRPQNLKYVNHYQDQATSKAKWLYAFRAAWLSEANPDRRKIMGQMLWWDAKAAHADEILSEVTGGDILSKTEITDATPTMTLPLKIVRHKYGASST